MWDQFNNYVSSVQTYGDLSPDLQIRQQVNQRLRHRQALKIEPWCREFQRVTRSSPTLLMFVYQAFQRYSGIEFSRVRPHDRLIEDLQFPLVCWFDWTTSFCEDFIAQFGVDLSELFDEAEFVTLADVIIFLELQVSQAIPSQG
ncbi:MAG: hypothetical protein AAFR42_09045 [Cyanobacteria bacterium J06628_6]